MEDLVTALFATDLRALVFSLLDHAEDPASTDLLARLEGVRRTVGGLAHVLDPAWREHVEGRLAGVRRSAGAREHRRVRERGCARERLAAERARLQRGYALIRSASKRGKKPSAWPGRG